jgi:DNA-directed RNA polymerase subunit B'
MFYEMLVAKACAKKGTHADGTIFKKFDQEAVADDLEAMGVQRYGYQRLINGITGEYIDALVFCGPIYYQRLQKFVVDVVYSITQGPSDAITFQPLDLISVQVELKTLLVCVWQATYPNCGNLSIQFALNIVW